MVGILGPELVFEPVDEKVPESYPQVQLGIGQGEVEHQVGVVWLENQFIRVAISPTLGGRILSIEDLRTETTILDMPVKLPVISGGARGVSGTFGVEFLAGKNRSNALGHVDYRIKDAASLDDAVAVFLHEWVDDMSWHGVVTLPPDRASIIIEQKIQNRSWHSRELRSGIRFSEMSESGFWVNFWETGGIQLVDAEGYFGLREDGTFATMPEDGRLGGRRVDQWKVELIPFSSIGDHWCTGDAVSVGQVGCNLLIQAHQDLENCKVFLYVDQQTLEAPLELKAGASSSTDLGEYSGRVEGVVVRDGRRETLAAWPSTKTHRESKAIDFPHALFDQMVSNPSVTGLELRRIPGAEALGFERIAVEHIRSQEWDRADDAMEKYLAYHAEDGLAWWLKASILRESGRERREDDRELPNAHYLIPLEPILKAEAFLNTPQAQTSDPNPLLASVAADPGIAAGVVEMYFDKGLLQGMARVADELLRHRQNAMIHYLVAAALILNEKMETTAAEHVAMAERLPIEPPFPYRFNEVLAVEILKSRFPSSERLQKTGRLIESARRSGLIDDLPIQE